MPLMKRMLCLALAWLGVAASLGASSPEPRFLTFSAKGKHGIYLRNLKIAEVELFVDGQPVKVSYLGYKNVETAVAFILENSPRTAPHVVTAPGWGPVNPIDQIRYQLLGDYFNRLVKMGEVMIVEFSKERRLLQDFTDDEFQLNDAINRMTPNSLEAMIDEPEVGRAFAFGLERLRDRPEKRKILILVTTTVDRETYRNMEEYQELLRRHDIDLYVVSFAPRNMSGPGVTFEQMQNTRFFRNLVGETAGRLYLTGEYTKISQFMDDLKTRLENSYTIGFYVNPATEPTEHTVRIVARDEKVDVTSRKKIIF
jgi:VWFA-related protein